MKARICGHAVSESEIYPHSIKFENQKDIQALLEKLFSAKFRFNSNGTIKADGTFLSGMTVLEYYKIHDSNIPTQDIVIVPHAFFGSYRNRDLFKDFNSPPYGDDIPLKAEGGETSVSIWIKEHPEPEPKKEKRVKKLYRCPACGDTLTEEEYQKDLASGGIGYCSCRFSAKDEHGNIWFPREYVEYEVFTREEN